MRVTPQGEGPKKGGPRQVPRSPPLKHTTDHNPLGKYFNIELKSIVAQHENLAAKGIFGVRVPLRLFFSFRSNKNNPRDFFTDQ